MTTATRKQVSSGTSFRTGAKDLLEALTPLGGVSPVRSPRPILGHLRLSVSNNRVEACATDLEMWLTARAPLRESSGEGKLAVPADPLLQILREAGDRDVEVSWSSGGPLALTCGRDRFELTCMPAEEFPECAERTEGAQWSLAAGVLPKLLKGTAFAAARERTRYTLNGVHWSAGGGHLEVVATDGRRLALARASAKVQGKAVGILPTRAITLLSQIGERPLALVLGERSVEARTTSSSKGAAEHILVSRLLEGQFPDYTAVIPKGYPSAAEAEASDLLAAFRRASLLSQESRSVRLQFSKGSLALTGGDPGRGQAKVEVDLDYKGPEVDLRLNPDYVMEGLKAWPGGTVRWEIRDSVSPCVLKGGEDHLYVVLPITLE